MSAPPLPDALRHTVAADLSPVRPLPRPSRRVLWLAPWAGLLLVVAAALFGVRADAVRLGPWLTWGASALESALGLLLAGAALREAVPGTSLTRRAAGAAFATALLLVVLVTWATWAVSPIRIAPPFAGYVWRVCFASTILSALPPLAAAGWLVARAFPLRPRLAGALYGLGAGLMADAGWRLFCHYSDPAHVVGAHLAAVGIVTVIGMAGAAMGGRR